KICACPSGMVLGKLATSEPLAGSVLSSQLFPSDHRPFPSKLSQVSARAGAAAPTPAARASATALRRRRRSGASSIEAATIMTDVGSGTGVMAAEAATPLAVGKGGEL